MNAVFQDPGPCRCGTSNCTAWGTKLAKKTGHLIDCLCASCQGRANQRNGKKGELRRESTLRGRKAHTDEFPDTYPIAVTTSDKVGEQVPESFVSFVESEWFRHAMAQAEKKIAVGNDALPALYLELASGGVFLVVDATPKSKLFTPTPSGSIGDER